MPGSVRRRVIVRVVGRVQGVGFRPAVYRHAVELGVTGSVRNTPAGVLIEAEGPAADVARFLGRLRAAPPSLSRIDAVEVRDLEPVGHRDFRIEPSARSGDPEAGMPPDMATCGDCLREIRDPRNRRFGHPFATCTACGPRFTIITGLPYDRERTSMAGFSMCPACAAEYADPRDRRFDAQPIACPSCGPSLRLIGADGARVAGDPIAEASRLLAQGRIVAVKGLGGYHLACLATDDRAVAELRTRKKRPHKALAVLVADVEQARAHCLCSADEERLLASAEAPIVILAAGPRCALSRLVSPDTRDIGVFLPCTPVQHLLLAQCGPLVMTSGNLAEEPIVATEAELPRILGPIAGFALVHDRAIVRRCDDSVVLAGADGPVFLRRSRGYVPNSVRLPASGPSALAYGAEVKNTFCVTRGSQACVSQHIGDLADWRTESFLRQSVADFCDLLGVTPEIVACDLHPGYRSSRLARLHAAGRQVEVQHHHAHAAACMVENGLRGEVLAITLDGTGYGADGTLWGGEFLAGSPGAFRRAGHFRAYAMPGGESAIRRPDRMAMGVLAREFGDEAEEWAAVLFPDLPESERVAVLRLARMGTRAPLTSSAGRLLDAAAAMLGLCREATYEGRPPIVLQHACNGGGSPSLGFDLDRDAGATVLSFGPMFRALAAARRDGAPPAGLAADVHATVAAGVVEAGRRVAAEQALTDVVLSGGVFQNAVLAALIARGLSQAGLRVHVHRVLPPNDACVSLGQAAVALATAS